MDATLVLEKALVRGLHSIDGMARASKSRVVEQMLARYGQTFADSLGIHLERNTPAPLFQMLCASLLFGARIAADNAARAMRALLEAGLTTPKAMAQAKWQRRVDIITWHGYKRYDERTSTMLYETAALVMDRYHGDLRRLRGEAGRDVDREHALLKQFKGIGDVGADIFLREVQLVWPEAYPYADEKVLKASRALGLGDTADKLARLVDRQQFPALVAGLVRVELGKAYDDIHHAA